MGHGAELGCWLLILQQGGGLDADRHGPGRQHAAMLGYQRRRCRVLLPTSLLVLVLLVAHAAPSGRPRVDTFINTNNTRQCALSE